MFKVLIKSITFLYIVFLYLCVLYMYLFIGMHILFEYMFIYFINLFFFLNLYITFLFFVFFTFLILKKHCTVNTHLIKMKTNEADFYCCLGTRRQMKHSPIFKTKLQAPQRKNMWFLNHVLQKSSLLSISKWCLWVVHCWYY